MKLTIALLLVAQIAINNIHAQSKLSVLKKGDMVPPNLLLGKMINYKSQTAKISDFKNKLIILDFWSSHCGPCVAGLPRMDSLQRQFGSEIAIIPIDYEKTNLVMDYFRKKKFALPSVVEDTSLNRIFPQLGLDMHIWIDKKGEIIATTGGEEVTSKKITEYFKTGKLNVKERVDAVGIYDSQTPLFIHGNGGDYSPIYQSVLAKAVNGAIGSMSRDFDFVNNEAFTFFFNAPKVNAFTLYKTAFSFDIHSDLYCRFYVEKEGGSIESVLQYCKKGLTSTSVYDSISNLLYPSGDMLAYSIVIPKLIANDELFFRKYMLEDLNRYFNYRGEIKKLKVSSWVIVRANNGRSCLAMTNDTTASQIIFDDKIEENQLIKINNMEFENFMTLLTGVGRDIHMYYMSPIVINETGYESEKINLYLDLKYKRDKAFAKPLNLEEWRAALQRNGLDIRVEDREVEVMVFKKKENPAK